MSAIVIRNIPDDVHDALRRIAAERREPVEAVARKALADLAETVRPKGIDFEKLRQVRAQFGLFEDGPHWGPEMDDPALSWRVLGMEPPEAPPKKARAKASRKRR